MPLMGLFSKKDEKTDAKEKKDEPTKQEKQDVHLHIDEVPKDKCEVCDETFKPGIDAYKCPDCGNFYHYPKCLKRRSKCKSCGNKIVEKDNIVQLIKTKQVVCPKCKKKVKLDFSTDDKVQVNCPNCNTKGLIPNPYLGEIEKLQKHQLDIETLEKQLEGKVEVKKEEKEKKVEKEVEPAKKEEKKKEKGKADEKEDEEDKEAIKPSDVKQRKPKLTILKKSITCHVCLGSIKTGLPVVVCRCGKKFHETCANRVGFCPICEGDLTDYEPEGELAEELIAEREKKPEVDMEIEPQELSVDIEPEPKPEPKRETKKEPEPEPVPEPEPEPEEGIKPRSELDSNLTFDSYKVDDHNRIIYNIAQNLAQAPGKEFNIMYLYGGKGMGKTHLLHAIGNYILENKSDMKVVYTSTKQLFEDLKEAHSSKKLEDLEKAYYETDVLMIEDFQDIPKAKSGQDAISNIFENLIKNKKQIILTGDRFISEIKTLQKNVEEKLADASIIKIIQLSSDLRKELLKKEVSSVFQMVDELIDEESSDEDLEKLKEKLAKMLLDKKEKKK